MSVEMGLLLLATAAISFAFGRLFGRQNMEEAVAIAIEKERKRQEDLSPLERVLGEEDEDA